MLGYHTRAKDKKGCREKCKRKKKKRYPRSQNLRYNCGKHKVLNYSMWLVRGQGQQIRTSWLGRLAWWMMQHSPTVPKGEMTEEVVESVWSMDSTSRTPRRTLELAGRIGKRPVCMLIDLGTTGNYISAQECATRRIKIEKEQGGKELTMADRSSVKTLGRV